MACSTFYDLAHKIPCGGEENSLGNDAFDWLIAIDEDLYHSSEFFWPPANMTDTLALTSNELMGKGFT